MRTLLCPPDATYELFYQVGGRALDIRKRRNSVSGIVQLVIIIIMVPGVCSLLGSFTLQMSAAPRPRVGPNAGSQVYMQVYEVAERDRNKDSVSSIGGLIDSGQLGEAQHLLSRRIAQHGENYELLYLNARLLFKQGEFSNSLKVLQKCLVFRHEDSRVYKLMASNEILLNELDFAERSLKSAIHLSPTDFWSHFQLGMLYFVRNQFKHAVEELRVATQLGPTRMRAYDTLGLALEETGDYSAAINAFRTAIVLVRAQKLKDDAPYVHLAQYLYLNNQPSESLPLLRLATQLNPGSAEAFYDLGKVLESLGDDHGAASAFEHSVANAPQIAESHYALGRIYFKLGQPEKAQEELRLFQAIRQQYRGRVVQTH